MIEVIAFDFGQVIGFFDHGKALAKLAPCTDMSENEMFSAIYGSDLEDQFESGHITDQEFLHRCRTLCRLDCTDEFLRAAIADVFWPNEPLCALIPQLKRRYRLVLGSNTNAIHSRHYVQQFAGTLSHFDALVLSHEIGVRKPAPEFFEQVLHSAQCSPERCVFIDDLPDNIAGARACGLRGIVYNSLNDLLRGWRELDVKV